MEYLASLVFFPIATLFVAGLLFMHIGLRGKSSLIALLSMVLFIVWKLTAHWVTHRYFMTPGDQVFERVGQFSAHPMLDSIDMLVTIILPLVFCLSFFVSAISVSAIKAESQARSEKSVVTVGPETKALWVFAAISMALCLLGTYFFVHCARTGRNDVLMVVAAAVALSGLVCGTLLSAFAIRRKMMMKAIVRSGSPPQDREVRR